MTFLRMDTPQAPTHGVGRGRRDPRSATAPTITSIGVVVPARDEEDSIEACLAALADAAARVSAEVRTVVVLDRCQDRTSDRARQFAGVTLISPPPGHHGVGAARAAGVAELLRDPATAPAWIATTDADSTVPPNWLARQLAHARAGADVVVGTVRIDDWHQRDASLRERYLAEYAELVTPGAPRDQAHGHMHGANLSFRASAYRAVGGFEAVANDEDVRLIQRFEKAGRVMVWASDLAVVTSARRVGRAPAGFADYLDELAAASPAGEATAAYGAAYDSAARDPAAYNSVREEAVDDVVS